MSWTMKRTAVKEHSSTYHQMKALFLLLAENKNLGTCCLQMSASDEDNYGAPSDDDLFVVEGLSDEEGADAEEFSEEEEGEDADRHSHLPSKNSKKKKLAPIFEKKDCLPPQLESPSVPTSSSSAVQTAAPPLPDSQHDITKNPLWNYFERKNQDLATCKTCRKDLKRGASGTTSSLLKHLKLHKPIFQNYAKEKKIQQEEVAKKKAHIPLPPQQQQKVSDFMGQGVKWPAGGKDQNRVNNLVSKFVVQGLHAYSIVEEPGFKKLVECGFPKYTLPVRTTFSRTLIPNLYKEEKMKLKSLLSTDLSSTQSLSFTTDGWKSRSGHGYLSLTCHYVDNEFNYKHFTLSNKLFEESGTGEHIFNCLKNEMQEWNIIPTDATRPIPIYVVTDGGRNIVSAIKQSPWKHRECFAHKLQLVVEGAINQDESAQEMLQKCRKIVGHYHKSMAATTRMKKIQSQMGVSNPKNVVQMVDTRWNSEFLMLERLLELKSPISTELATSQHAIVPLTNEEWDLAEGYINALKPIEQQTNIMSADTYPTTSMIIPVLNEIENNLNNMINTKDQSTNSALKKKSFAKNLLQHLRTRFALYKEETLNQIATALDPRFKCVLLESNLIEKKLAHLADKKGKQTTSSAKPTSSSATPPTSSAKQTTTSTSHSNLWAAFNAAASKKQGYSFSPGAKEARRYLEDPLIDHACNPYDWWKSNALRYPLLCQLASEYLPIPATQASSERLFSAAGNIVTARRECLLPEHAEQLLFLHNLYTK